MVYNDTMPAPTKEEAVGYDAVIWMDPDGDPVFTPYTEIAEKFIREIIPPWNGEVVILVKFEPDVFLARLPSYLFVGIQNPESKIIYPTTKKVLQ